MGSNRTQKPICLLAEPLVSDRIAVQHKNVLRTSIARRSGGIPAIVGADFPDPDFGTIFGKADSPIGCCSVLLMAWGFIARQRRGLRLIRRAAEQMYRIENARDYDMSRAKLTY